MAREGKIVKDWTPEKIENWPALLAYMAENLVNISGYNPLKRQVRLWDGRTLVRKFYAGKNLPDFLVDLKKENFAEGLEVFLEKLLEEGQPFITNGFNLIGKRKFVTYFEWTIVS